MINRILDVYALLFSRPYFSVLNKLFFVVGARGLGLLNYRSETLSGEKWIIDNFLRDGDVVLDVGANDGGYSKACLDKGCSVYAFEPHPANYKNLVCIDGLRAYRVAVGSGEGKLELYDYKEKDGSVHASLYREVIEDIHDSESVSHVVDVIKIDEFCRVNDITKVDLLKIDVEGNEYAVLKGAMSMLESGSIRIIQFEFNEMNIKSRVFFDDFVKLLDGWNLYRMLPHGLLKLNGSSNFLCEQYAFQNIIALRKDDYYSLS
ncbi:MAG: FkbM family methyltransferase [Candidatus Sedimenticola sp. 20ELBAFRAG]